MLSAAPLREVTPPNAVRYSVAAYCHKAFPDGAVPPEALTRLGFRPPGAQPPRSQTPGVELPSPGAAKAPAARVFFMSSASHLNEIPEKVELPDSRHDPHLQGHGG